MEIRETVSGRSIGEWIVWVGVSLLAGVVGNGLSGTAVRTWYPTLVEPWFAPPNWVFGPVWITLYVLMGTAAFLVSRSADGRTRLALVVFLGQLVLNAAWSGAFFGLRSPAYGLVVIVPLLLGVGATTALFARIDRRAAALVTPYLLWTAFATLLNYQFWVLN
ncbi:TspO and MBR related proteins [Halopelagius inordinatus]|uniref:TspO and MBR related proteins n=1 Tax=Halopelagius inordinatus TaxID=553467 RepID=A0A1I2LKT1_9EURY|nr:TspO/MBR family protein [Halopelagius inordinatus]SFF79894.1 TspO and MBR related proteins [Halopelagius inordinatus]